MKRTKWFDGSKFIPSHSGLYERRYKNKIHTCFFDDSIFFVYVYSHNCIKISNAQNLPWRGLKERQK